MFNPIVMPLDGSLLADRAIPYAIRLARLQNARVLLVRVLVGGESKAVADAELAATREQLQKLGVVADSLLTTGNPGATIAELANREVGAMIVMSTHGRSVLSRWLHGSVAEDVLREANGPVVLIPSECKRAWRDDRPFRILIPLDGSPLSEQAFGVVRPLARSLNAEVTLLRVVDPSSQAYTSGHIGDTRVSKQEVASALHYLNACAADKAWQDRAPNVRAAVGHPDTAIIEAARTTTADLIVMATHGRSGLARLVLGSVAGSAVCDGDVPVLLTKRHDVAQSDGRDNLLLAS